MIINLKNLKENLFYKIKKEFSKLNKINPAKLQISIILTTSNLESKIFIEKKIKIFKKLKISCKTYYFNFEKDINQSKKIINLIKKLNQTKEVIGIITQLPLAKQLDQSIILNAISPNKDIDCLNPNNQGLLFQNGIKAKLKPAVVSAVIKIIQKYKIKILGKKILIINASILIGKPLAIICNSLGATVVICDKNSSEIVINEFIKISDIIIAATDSCIKISNTLSLDKKIFIDIGFKLKKEGDDFKVVGSLDKELYSRFKFVTPVPGGVGSLTIICAAENALILLKKQVIQGAR